VGLSIIPWSVKMSVLLCVLNMIPRNKSGSNIRRQEVVLERKKGKQCSIMPKMDQHQLYFFNVAGIV
jgi:hypothetical protein